MRMPLTSKAEPPPARGESYFPCSRGRHKHVLPALAAKSMLLLASIGNVNIPQEAFIEVLKA